MSYNITLILIKMERLKMKKIIFGCAVIAVMFSGCFCWWWPCYGGPGGGGYDGGHGGGHGGGGGMEMHGGEGGPR
jgi:hypothetical protein